ncbi:uncharacterized protein A4U43_C07F15140 [Asparagus officinalis]|uniref:Uncharacterized protein n=1 Tax=Asparagus officinalis TaxID=4686 RepID=A0A5P1EE19_ASPOF|nr:uncharacterized protein A4U43_C07F15140 [Asparagus officinalis]
MARRERRVKGCGAGAGLARLMNEAGWRGFESGRGVTRERGDVQSGGSDERQTARVGVRVAASMWGWWLSGGRSVGWAADWSVVEASRWRRRWRRRLGGVRVVVAREREVERTWKLSGD